MSRKSFFSRKQHGFIACFYPFLVISLSVMLVMPFTTPAAADTDITTQVTVGSGQTFWVSDDTNITLSSSQTGTGIIIAQNSSNVTISADAGKVLTITVDTPSTTSGGGRGIFVNSSDNVIISLGETHVIASNDNAVRINGSQSGNTATVATFGDKSTFESKKNAAVVGSNNAVINIAGDSTITGNSYGVTAGALFQNNGAIITVGNGAEISNQGANSTVNSIAVLSYNSANYQGGYIEIGDESKIYTTGTGSGNYAVLAGYISATGQVIYSGDVRIGKSADISTVGGTSSTGLGSHALISAGEGSTITVDDFATISTAGQQAAAVRAGISVSGVQTGGGTVTIGKSAYISTDGVAAIAVDSKYDDSKIIIGENATITTTGAGTTSGSSGSYGVNAQNNASVDIGRNAKITTSGNYARGVSVTSAGTATLGDETKIETGGTNAHGVYVSGSGSKATLGAGSNVTTAASIGAYAASGGTVDIGGGTSITTLGGSSAYGIQSSGNNSSLTLGAGSSVTTAASIGAYATSGGTVDIGGGASITTLGGSSAYGIQSNGNNSSLTLGAGSSVTTASADAVYASGGGSIELEGATISAASGDKNAIIASGRTGSTGRNSAVSGSGVFDITGNINAGQYGSIDITMDNGSLFTGATRYISGDTTSRLDLTLNGSTEWDVTDNSELTNLYMNGASVDMTYAALGAEIFVLNLGRSASDNGVFRMDADILDEFADHIYIGGTAQGTYRLDIVNDGSQATTGEELTDLVFVDNGQPVVFVLDHTVEAGGFQYELRAPDDDTGTTFLNPRAKHESNAWYLQGTGRASTPGTGAINSFAGSYLMAYADTQTLIQRMGDLRQSPYGQGLWFRVHGGKFESNSKSYVRGFDMDYGGVQIGYDRKLENKWGGDIYVGAMFGYSKGDLDYHRDGSGEVDSKTLGIYGTYIGRSGFYIDTILKYQWMTNDFDVIDTAGTLVRGQEADTGGIGASVEFGQRLHVGKGKESGIGWYVEPQVQLSYQRQDGGYFNATNGLRIGVEPFTSILGRLGMLVGYETDKTNFYAKVSKVKEFDGDLTIRANGVPISESFASSWWVYGIGCTSRINDRNSLYLDIERASGGSFSQPWRVLAGWRVEF